MKLGKISLRGFFVWSVTALLDQPDTRDPSMLPPGQISKTLEMGILSAVCYPGSIE